jgi:serine phosphatase RsbU (regulator of sigma subunit)
MLQSVVAALIKSRPGASPAEVVTTVNAVMFENVRGRLELDDHATLTLLSFDASTGVVEYAGAHEEILWWHASERCCERLATPGTWTALTPSVGGVTVTSRIRLAEGDRLVLYTDGIVEPLGASGDRFGVERLCEGVARVADLDVDEACAQLVGDVLEFQVRPQDDATLVVLQRAT